MLHKNYVPTDNREACMWDSVFVSHVLAAVFMFQRKTNTLKETKRVHRGVLLFSFLL